MGPQVFTYENGAYRVELRLSQISIKHAAEKVSYLSDKVSKVRNIALKTISSCKTFSRNYFRYISN